MDVTPSVLLVANLTLTRQVLNLLIEKGLISKEEAAQVLTLAAEDVRSATEDEPSPKVGETIARAMEVQAAWWLGLPPAF